MTKKWTYLYRSRRGDTVGILDDVLQIHINSKPEVVLTRDEAIEFLEFTLNNTDKMFIYYDTLTNLNLCLQRLREMPNLHIGNQKCPIQKEIHLNDGLQCVYVTRRDERISVVYKTAFGKVIRDINDMPILAEIHIFKPIPNNAAQTRDKTTEYLETLIETERKYMNVETLSSINGMIRHLKSNKPLEIGLSFFCGPVDTKCQYVSKDNIRVSFDVYSTDVFDSLNIYDAKQPLKKFTLAEAETVLSRILKEIKNRRIHRRIRALIYLMKGATNSSRTLGNSVCRDIGHYVGTVHYPYVLENNKSVYAHIYTDTTFVKFADVELKVAVSDNHVMFQSVSPTLENVQLDLDTLSLGGVSPSEKVDKVNEYLRSGIDLSNVIHISGDLHLYESMPQASEPIEEFNVNGRVVQFFPLHLDMNVRANTGFKNAAYSPSTLDEIGFGLIAAEAQQADQKIRTEEQAGKRRAQQATGRKNKRERVDDNETGDDEQARIRKRRAQERYKEQKLRENEEKAQSQSKEDRVYAYFKNTLMKGFPDGRNQNCPVEEFFNKRGDRKDAFYTHVVQRAKAIQRSERFSDKEKCRLYMLLWKQVAKLTHPDKNKDCPDTADKVFKPISDSRRNKKTKQRYVLGGRF